MNGDSLDFSGFPGLNEKIEQVRKRVRHVGIECDRPIRVANGEEVGHDVVYRPKTGRSFCLNKSAAPAEVFGQIGGKLMKKLFSTADVRANERFDYWHEVACQHIVGHTSTPESKDTFAAEIETGLFDDIELVSFSNSPMRVARTKRHIALSTSDELFICRQTSGLLTINQDGRSVTLGTGDMSLLDPLLPYTANFSGNSRLLVVKIPRGALKTRIGNPRFTTAAMMKPSEPINRWLSSNLAMLPSMVGRWPGPSEALVKVQMLDLIAASLLLGLRGSLSLNKSSSRFEALLRLKAAIDTLLVDPHLSAANVAGRAGMSVRYANELLAEDKTSIRRLVLSMRLTRCRAALDDALQTHRTISDIARAWGFRDMTHFGRCFRNTYGLLPSDYRKHKSRPGVEGKRINEPND